MEGKRAGITKAQNTAENRDRQGQARLEVTIKAILDTDGVTSAQTWDQIWDQA